MTADGLSRRRAGIYLEVECLGVSERDAAQRAIGALAELTSRHEMRVRMHFNGPHVEGDDGVVTIVNAEPLGDAARSGAITVRRRGES